MYFENSTFSALEYPCITLQKKRSSAVQADPKRKAERYPTDCLECIVFPQNVQGGRFALRFFAPVRTDLP